MKLNKSPLAVRLVACLTIVLAFGCSSQEMTHNNTQSARPTLIDLSPNQKKQKQQALLAKENLFASLLGELTTSMGEKGPAKSISVCKERAPEIARRVSEEANVRIGRTSFLLRNENNAAPDWAASFVNDRVEDDVAVELSNNGLGVLLPIRLQATCTLCHGTDQQVMPEVKAAIVSNYPKDQATGFSEGALRGYFWIEVPALGEVNSPESETDETESGND